METMETKGMNMIKCVAYSAGNLIRIGDVKEIEGGIKFNQRKCSLG